MQVDATSPLVFIPNGAGTYASPFDNVEQLEYLAAPKAETELWDLENSRIHAETCQAHVGFSSARQSPPGRNRLEGPTMVHDTA